MTIPTRQTRPPGTITLSFLGFLAATVTTVAGAVFLATSGQALEDELRRRGASLSDSEIDAAVTFTQGIGIAVAAVIVLGYLWLAFKLKAGRNWARVVLTVLTLLTLLQVGFLFVGDTADALAYVSCALAVIAMVLSYLPASNAYINSVRHAG
jgi:phosphatidylserine synthase